MDPGHRQQPQTARLKLPNVRHKMQVSCIAQFELVKLSAVIVQEGHVQLGKLIPCSSGLKANNHILLWDLKNRHETYFGIFGAPGIKIFRFSSNTAGVPAVAAPLLPGAGPPGMKPPGYCFLPGRLISTRPYCDLVNLV